MFFFFTFSLFYFLLYYFFQFCLYVCFFLIFIIIAIVIIIIITFALVEVIFYFLLTVVHWSHFVILFSVNNRGFPSATQTFKSIFTHETESRFSFLTFSCVVISSAVSRPKKKKKFRLPVMCWSFLFTILSLIQNYFLFCNTSYYG